tara:strand:- start:606 stop:836 length:231 start_codon:yes stop_codon:yes gene_type:complete
MYLVVVAVVLASSGIAQVPVAMQGYSTLMDCRAELLEISKIPQYELIINPLMGYSVAKSDSKSMTTAFCVRDLTNI